MAQLSDNIEHFIKELMCEDARVELCLLYTSDAADD